MFCLLNHPVAKVTVFYHIHTAFFGLLVYSHCQYFCLIFSSERSQG